MIVRRVDNDRLTYEAREPRTGSRWHRVDLEAFGGNGNCACEHFTIRLAKKARGRAAMPIKVQARLQPIHCKHLSAVFVHWAREALWKIAAHMRQQHPDREPSPHNRHD